jgi:RNA polymerase sigma-70 factor (ECF subfamily)
MVNPTQLDDLFASCVPRLQKTALRMMRNKEDSEDALQNALLLGFRNIHQFRGRAKFSTWMHSILINAVRSMRRSQLARPITASLDQEIFQGDEAWNGVNLHCLAPNPEEECSDEEKRRIIGQLVCELPCTYRDAVWLREVEGLPIRQIAKRLRVHIGTVKARVHRGCRMIERNLQTRRVSFATSALPRLRQAGIRRRQN